MLLTEPRIFIKKIQEGRGIGKLFQQKMDYIRNKKLYENISCYFIKNTPSYFEGNMEEWVNGMSSSDIEICGITINQILSAHNGMSFLEALDAVIMVHNEFISAGEVLADGYKEKRVSMFPREENIKGSKIILMGNYSMDKKVQLSQKAVDKVYFRLTQESGLNHKALFKHMMENCLPELEPNLIEWAKGEPLSEIMVGNLSANMLLKSWDETSLEYALPELKSYKKHGCENCLESMILSLWKTL